MIQCFGLQQPQIKSQEDLDNLKQAITNYSEVRDLNISLQVFKESCQLFPSFLDNVAN
jgi:hypothetical protein